VPPRIRIRCTGSVPNGPVEHQDLELHLAVELVVGHVARAERHGVGERQTARLGEFQDFAGTRCALDVLQHVAGRPLGLEHPGERRQVDPRAVGVQVQVAARELGQLAKAPGQRDPPYRVTAQVLERPADEVAHVDQRDVRHAVERLDAALRGRAGDHRHVVDLGRPGDIDAAMDRVDPGGARVGHDDAGRAEDRQAPDDAEPSVGGARREYLAARDRKRHLEVTGVPVVLRDRRHDLADQLARLGIDRRLADRHRQARPGHDADSFAGDEQDARAGVAARDARADHRAVGHVRVVTGVLDHRGIGLIGAERLVDDVEERPLAARQPD
jgi:hypothetical protein